MQFIDIMSIIKERKYTAYAIGKHSGLSATAVQKILNGGSKPNRATIEKLHAFVLQMGDIKPEGSITSESFTAEELMIISSSVYYQQMWVEKQYGGEPAAKYAALVEKLSNLIQK